MKRILSTVLIFVSSVALAWGDVGHMSVALVAYEDLKANNPDVLAKVISALKKHPYKDDLLRGSDGVQGEELDKYMFAMAATWPDIARNYHDMEGSREHHGSWHFVNIPFENGAAGVQPDSSPWVSGMRYNSMNLYHAVDKAEHDIRDSTVSRNGARMLSWLFHLTGDIHQPLHSTALWDLKFNRTRGYEEGDRGGTRFYYNNNERDSLHSYWDGIPGKSGEGEFGRAERYTRETLQKYTRADFTSELAVTGVRDWAKESFEIAKKHVYLDGNLQPNSGLSGDYKENARAVARQRIALAGFRLADKIKTLLE